MSRHAFVLCAVILVTFLSSCDGGPATKSQETPSPSPAAENPIGKSKGGSYLTIRKEMLGQEFLLQSAIAYQRGTGTHVSNPTSESLKSRIVTFEEKGDEVLMLESEEGYQPGDELAAHTLISTFPIIGKDDKIVTFDFNKGMTNVLMGWDWVASDFGGDAIEPDVALTVEHSYLREIIPSTESTTVIQTLSAKKLYLIPIEVTYYISKYTKNPNYTPVESPGFDYLGYFEASPLVQKGFGDSFNYITRWDISKPVIFYIANFPKEFQDAAMEGVLYWNSAFGKNVLEAKIAPEGVTAPDFKHNIIQWHTNSTGMAYADAALDPRTGEILHGQVFFSSGFASWVDYTLLKEYNDSDAVKKDTIISARQTEESRLCTIELGDLLTDSYIYRDTIQSLSPERITAVAKDVIRNIVAHEVGHVMGLRHNFAASAVDDLTGEQEKSVFKKYLATGKLPAITKPLLNSVMDYSSFAVDVLVGAQMAADKKMVFPHDKYAIQWGYFGSEEKPKYTGEIFCTDSQVAMFNDCERHDSGKHLVERKLYGTNASFTKIPHLIYEAYLRSKIHPNPRYRKPITESTPEAIMIAAPVAGYWSELIYYLTSDLSLVSVFLRHPDLTDIDNEKISAEVAQWLENEIKFAGGIKALFGLIAPTEFKRHFEEFPQQFNQIVSANKNLSLPEGGETSFANEEISYMKSRAKELFPAIRENLAALITQVLQGGGFKPLSGIEDAEPILASWAEYLITEGKGLEFDYSYDTRLAAIGLLNSEGPYPDWLDKFIQPIAEKLRAKLEEGLGMPLEEVDVSKFPRDKQRWISNEINLYYMIGQPNTVPPEPVPLEK